MKPLVVKPKIVADGERNAASDGASPAMAIFHLRQKRAQTECDNSSIEDSGGGTMEGGAKFSALIQLFGKVFAGFAGATIGNLASVSGSNMAIDETGEGRVAGQPDGIPG